MKISLALMFLVVFQVSASDSFAQTKVSLNAENITLERFFTELERQTGDIFVFSNADVDAKQKINVTSNEEVVTELLDRILKGIGLGYSVHDGYISVYKNRLAPEVQQNVPRTVKGYVIGGGAPMVGVTVVLKGTTQGTATDASGYFVMQYNPQQSSTLVFSYIGYKTQEVKIGGLSELAIILEPETVKIDDVVVTGYQTIERGRATGSFEVVSPQQTSMVVSNDIVDKLEGIVPGLAVNSDGEMMIRGQATIYAQTAPLVVVDGFPMEYGTSNINPNDIESISVLKDAASASIWGVRAANGVIVITTKRGAKNQKTTVSYTGNVKIGSKFDVSSLGYLNSSQQIDFEREKFADYPTSISNIGPSYSLSFSEAAWIEYQYQNGLNGVDDARRETLFGELAAYNNYKDIEKYFYRNSLLQTHNIVVAGGSESITNYLSLNYENSLNDLVGNKSNSFGVQLNSTFDLHKRIRLTTGVRGNYSSRDIYSGSPASMKPYVRIKDGNGDYVNEYYGVSQLMKDDLESKGYGDWSYNRLKDRSLTDNNTRSYNVAVNAQLDIDILKGLKFTTSGMFIVDHSGQEVLNTIDSYYTRDLFNRFTSHNGGTLTNYLPEGAVKNMYNLNSTSYTFRNTLNYNYTSGDFSMSLMGGCELFAIRTKTESDTYYGYDPQGMNYDHTLNFYDLVNTGVVGYDPSTTQRLSYSPLHADAEDRYFSTFFTGSFSYTERYTLFGSIRYDKTNLYGRSGKYRDQPTWSVGGKWNISQETFFNAPKVDALALKLSYGLSGNIDKTTSPYLIASNVRDLMLGLPALAINNPANEQLAWEKVYSFNAGLELAMFGNRLNLSADYYMRNTRDALGYIVTDPTTGWDAVKKNTASLSNRGIDLSISGSPVANQNVRWTSTLTFSYNYNEVTKVNAGEETAEMYRSGNPLLGRPVDYIYAYRHGGLSTDGELQIKDAAGNIYAYQDVAGFAPEDLMIMGRRSPKYFGAWSNVVSFKGFTFDMLVTYKLGHKMHMPSIYGAAERNERIYKTFDKRWREPGDEANTWVPKAKYAVDGPFTYTMNSNDKMIESGDLVRLKSLGLSYDFKRIIKTDVLSAINLKFSVENPWFWAANRDGLDPDRLYNGNSDSYYSGNAPTFYTFTLNLKF